MSMQNNILKNWTSKSDNLQITYVWVQLQRWRVNAFN